jgi:hypothetical protein
MNFQIPESPDALLTRDHTAAALTASGFPVKAKTLATKATRGGGPTYRLFGTKPLYRWGDALRWANARLSKPVTNTSELDAVPVTNTSELDAVPVTNTSELDAVSERAPAGGAPREAVS